MILRHTVTTEEDGAALYTVLRRSLGLSATQVKRLKRVPGGILLDGAAVYTRHRVVSGDEIVCDLHLVEPACDIIPENGLLSIIYEDEGLLAVNKPPGLLVHPSSSRNTGTLLNIALGHILKDGPGGCHVVNRLDRDTSGAVLFSKNAHLKHLAIAALHQEAAKKEYLALVLGAPADQEGVIDLPIRRVGERDLRRVVAPDGDRAVTHYRTLGIGRLGDAVVSAVAFRLLTGRTHQIRVHCLEMGFPILGDILYHTPESRICSEALGLEAQQLHCRRLSFSHPMTRTPLTIEAPVERPDLSAALKALL